MRRAITVVGLLSVCLAGAAQRIAPATQRAIDSIAQHYIGEYAITGLSIGIVHQGKSETFHYGYTDLTHRYAVSDSTMFHLASVSKLFTATAIMQLVEAGKLTLDDRLCEVLPEFKMKDKRYKDIRIRHLLTHTSGLMWDNTLDKSPDDTTSIPLFVQQLHPKKLNFTPGEKLSYKTYSNAAFDLSGILIERKTGKTFDRYVMENILRPVGMRRSTYFFEEIDAACLAQPIALGGRSSKSRRINLLGLSDKEIPIDANFRSKLIQHNDYGETYEHNPSGNLIASAGELNLWMLHVLKTYSVAMYSGIIRQPTLSEMWTTQKDIPGKNTSIGLGWWIYQDPALGKSVFHVGNQLGFCSILMIYPEQDWGIVILCNGAYAQKAVWNKMTGDIARLFLLH